MSVIAYNRFCHWAKSEPNSNGRLDVQFDLSLLGEGKFIDDKASEYQEGRRNWGRNDGVGYRGTSGELRHLNLAIGYSAAWVD